MPLPIKSLYLMPTVDHVDPLALAKRFGEARSASVLEFQICSWRINECKSGLTPEEFVGLCRRVAARATDVRI